MKLSDKYNIPEETIKKMVKDGVFQCAIIKQDEIVTFYQKKVSEGLPRNKAVQITSIEMNTSESWVYRLIKKLTE